MTNDQRDQIIDSIIKEVEDRGSARVGFHAESILKQKSVVYSDLSKIEAKIIQNKKYLSRSHPKNKGDYEIYKNPNWKRETFWTKNPFFEKVLLVLIAAALAQVPNYILSRQAKSNQQAKDSVQQLKDAKQDSLLRKFSDSFFSIHKDQNKFNEKSLSLQDSQLRFQEKESKYSKRPSLSITNMYGGEIGETSWVTIGLNISNGDVFNLSYSSIKGTKIKKETLPTNGFMITGSEYKMTFENIIDGGGVKLRFSDMFGNRYTQSLIWTRNDQTFHFGELRDIGK